MNIDKMTDAIGRIDDRYVEQAKAPMVRRLSFKRGVMLAAAVILCMSLTVTTLAAAGNDAVYRALYTISPSLAQALVPVRVSDVDNGIEMQVDSAYIEGNTAYIVVAMRDLEGDRVDHTMDLYDSYRIHRAFDSTGMCQFLEYDEETETARFLVTISQWGDADIAGNKITFSVREFLSHKTEFEDIIPISWDNVPTVTDTILREYAEREKNETIIWQEACLIPDSTYADFTSGIDVTGYGYIDGEFHIQIAVRDRLKNDNHGTFYLVDENGNRRYCDYSVDWCNNSGGERVDYVEYVFAVPREEIEKQRLFGYFVTSNGAVQGDWQVTVCL